MNLLILSCGTGGGHNSAAAAVEEEALRIPKQAGGGVTFALALRPYAPDWRWQHE